MADRCQPFGVFGLRRHDGVKARRDAGRNVRLMPRRIGGIDANHASPPRLKPFGGAVTRRVLHIRRDRILEIDDDLTRPAGLGLAEALGPIARHEQKTGGLCDGNEG
jgi:hypothetical protein